MVEFVVMFPVTLAFLWYLLKVQLTINTSIVGQKYARSQVFLKTLNHRDYPVAAEYVAHPGKRSVFWLGVGAEPIQGNTRASAPIMDLGIGLDPRPLPGSRNDPGEPDASMPRQRVRVRTAFGLCTSRKPNADGSLSPYCGEVTR